MENGSKMRHLMWILTWIAVGIGGALGAASVIMLSARPTPSVQTPEVVAPSKTQDPVLVTKPRPGSPGRSRHIHPIDHAALTD